MPLRLSIAGCTEAYLGALEFTFVHLVLGEQRCTLAYLSEPECRLVHLAWLQCWEWLWG